MISIYFYVFLAKWAGKYWAVKSNFNQTRNMYCRNLYCRKVDCYWLRRKVAGCRDRIGPPSILLGSLNYFSSFVQRQCTGLTVLQWLYHLWNIMWPQVGQMNNLIVLPPSLEWSWLGTLRSWSFRPRLCQPSWTCQESPEQSLSQKKCLKRLGLTIFSLLIKNIGFFWYEGQTGTSKILPSQYLGMGGYYPPFSLLVHSRDLLGNRFGQVGHHLVEISQGEGLVLQSRCKKRSTWMYIQVSLACYLDEIISRLLKKLNVKKRCFLRNHLDAVLLGTKPQWVGVCATKYLESQNSWIEFACSVQFKKLSKNINRGYIGCITGSRCSFKSNHEYSIWSPWTAPV